MFTITNINEQFVYEHLENNPVSFDLENISNKNKIRTIYSFSGLNNSNIIRWKPNDQFSQFTSLEVGKSYWIESISENFENYTIQEFTADTSGYNFRSNDITDINMFFKYDCITEYSLAELSLSVSQKIRRIYSFVGPQKQNIVRWTPGDPFSGFTSLNSSSICLIESKGENFDSYNLGFGGYGPDSCVSNYANYNSTANWNVTPSGNITSVESNGGPSAYNTFDMSGNVYEWNDKNGVGSVDRGIRGGWWFSEPQSDNKPPEFFLSSSGRKATSPEQKSAGVGFRLCSSLNPLFLNNFELVDDADNTNDSTGYGSVSTNYLIGKYTVTNCEYATFLNSVDPEGTNPQGLYNANMNSNILGGISLISSNPNGSKYATKTNMSNKPVVFVSWFDCARYCNWLHNGALSYNTTSAAANARNTGAYNIGMATAGNAVSKESNADYHIPTENEWYKAAYYKGGSINAGYWAYATQSNIAPTPVTASSTGDGLVGEDPARVSNYSCSAGSNSANYSGNANWNGTTIGNITSVGSSGGPSSYGTYDQSGNTSDWNDLDGTPSSSRGIRGGEWSDNAFSLSSSIRLTNDSSSESGYAGFRLCSSFNPLNISNFVVVEDANNAVDTNGYGSVSSNYFIGKYSVTNCEYKTFLNSIDPEGTNPQGLYNANMNSSVYGGISLISSNPNGSKYVAKTNMSNKPVVYVSWFDAARYCNWLHNGAATYDTTAAAANHRNTGAYNVGTATTGNAVVREFGATYHIPTENEWYKAAYYKGGGINAGYWLYATQSNTNPIQVTANSIGDGLIGENPANKTSDIYSCIATAGRNSANYDQPSGNITSVGSNGGPSSYGVYDQSGNVNEWNDLNMIPGQSFNHDPVRGQRGGRSFSSSETTIGHKRNSVGFRLCSSFNSLYLDNFELVSGANNFADSTGYGSVSTNYLIGKYTVTNCEYATFLNSVDPQGTNPQAIYDGGMSEDIVGGISLISSNPNGSKYVTKNNMGNKPVVYVSWINAAQYCNWLHNGKLSYSSTAEAASSINNGAYNLATANTGNAVAREVDAAYYIPTENEWYKAAYYKGGSINAGYWAYATQSNAAPTKVTVGLTGDGLISGSAARVSDYRCLAAAGSNSANYSGNANWNGTNIGNITSVGSSGGPSSYGTYDQSGNTSDWNDLDGTPSSSRGVRGGGWLSVASNLSSENRSTFDPSSENDNLGFRLCSSLNSLSLNNFKLVGSTHNLTDSNSYGGVNYNYFIGKYSVTNCEYATFLNSVDPQGSNPQSIYSTSMNSNARGGITLNSGNANGSKYVTKTNMSNKPVVYVSWFSCARYCNWLHNGALPYDTTDNTANAPQNNGAYNVGIATTGNAVIKESNADYYIPTEDEWYKAAYYKGGSTNAGYYLYATQSNIAPTPVTANSAGNGLINENAVRTSDYSCPSAPAGSNSANYSGNANWNATNGNITSVGSNGGPSSYNTFDMSGNVFEWNDLDGTTSSSRGFRGGDWSSSNIAISSSFRLQPGGPEKKFRSVSFRLCSSLNPLFLNNFELVSNANNVADTYGYGSVSHSYFIGKYSVTNCEYVNFLNSVDPQGTNPQTIYSAAMNSSVYGGISLISSNPNGSKYVAKTNMSNKPVVYVSWFNAARYCNWLHNGALPYNTTSAAANARNTGAYSVGTTTTGNAVTKESNADYYIPTEDEWYKAAYYKGGSANAGYYLYATQSNIVPTPVTANLIGDGLVGEDPARVSDYICP